MNAPFLYPDFELYLSSRSAPLTKTDLPASSVTFSSAYGQVTALQFTVNGDTVNELQETGILEPGVEVLEFRAGYAGSLVSIAKRLLIWDDEFSADSSGDSLTITAYGCSQRLRESGQRTIKLKAKTIKDAVVEVCSRHGVKAVIGTGAYRASTTATPKTQTANTTKPATTPATKPTPFSVGGGITATIDTVTPEQAQAKATPNAASTKPVLALWQKGESDWDFLEKLVTRVGYILTESPDGAFIVCGPGLEIGDRPVFVLTRGDYAIAGQPVQGTISSLSTRRSLWGLPSEILVTGWEKGKPFVQVVKPEDLAESYKVTVEPARVVVRGGQVGGGITASIQTSDTPTPAISTPSKTASKPSKGKITKVKIVKAKTVGSGAANFAAKTVREFLNLTGLSTRRVYTGSSSKDTAKARAIEALALQNLNFQETSVSSVGQPEIRAGFEVMLEGSGVPEVLQGKHLVRAVELQFSSSEFTMNLTLNRNVAR